MAAAKLKQFLAGHQGSTGRYRVLDGVGSGRRCQRRHLPSGWVHPEALRLVAYGAFWAMVLLAIAMHSLFVRGVDMDDTPLVRLFGYNNICICGTTPSRNSRPVLPLVEFPLLACVVLNWLQVRQSHRQGAPRSGSTACQALPGQLVLLSWFRMVFVVMAFETWSRFRFQAAARTRARALQDVLYMDPPDRWPRCGRKLARRCTGRAAWR